MYSSKYINFILMPIAASANIETDIMKAAAIENNLERLAAYDDVARKYRLSPDSKRSGKATSKWHTSSFVSPIDDRKTIVCRVDANESVKVGYRTIVPSLIIRLRGSEADAYINYDTFLGSNDIRVTYRIGKDTAQTTSWAVSTDRKAVFFKGNVSELINKLDKTDSLVVEITPYAENPLIVNFNPSGLLKAIEAQK